MKLSLKERLFLLVPFVGGVVFGLLPLFAPGQFAKLTGFSGHDPYMYGLAGAATFGYAIALFFIIQQGEWHQARPILFGTITFNAVSLLACILEIAKGTATPIVYAILLTSVLIVGLVSKIVGAHKKDTTESETTLSTYQIRILQLGTIAAIFFGVFPLFPDVFAKVFGLLGTDQFLFRQGGAAACGYAVMGLMYFTSPHFRERKLAILMSAIFNGLSFLVSVYYLLIGQGNLLVYTVLPASLFFCINLSYFLIKKK